MDNNLPVRERIIQTASTLFYKQGFNRTGINEIIAQAEVAKASLYAHFKSKDDLCLAYLQRMQSGLLTNLKEFLKDYELGRERVLAIFDFLEDFYHTDGFRGCWCLNTISEIPKDNERIQKEILLQKRHFMRLIQEVVGQNLPDVMEEVNRKSLRIYLLYESAIMESQVQQSPWPIHEAKEMAKVFLK